jgi:hypothetical protein
LKDDKRAILMGGVLEDMDCPIDFDYNRCSSKDFGLQCDTCVHAPEFQIYQHGLMWVVSDDKYIATGKTRDGAIDNFIELLNKEYARLKQKVDQDIQESRTKHRKLWNY